MPVPKKTHYEVLGVPNDAKLTDIGRAYNRLKSDLQRDTAVPDPKRAVLLKEAHETLSDPERREAYDVSLKVSGRRKRSRGALVWTLAIVGGTAAAVAGYFTLRPPPEAPPGALAAQDIALAATLAVSRVQRVDVSGDITPIGLAFAIDEGVMVTSCHGVAPGSQLTVNLAPRVIPARVATVDDKLGLCKLAAEGVGARPLEMSGATPKAGDAVYATRVNAVGEVALIEGQVKQVVADPHGTVIEATIPMSRERAGGPLLDAFGRVVAVATFAHADGQGRNMALPRAWIVEARAPRTTPTPRAAPVEPAPSPSADPYAVSTPPSGMRVPRSVEDIPAERRENLEKAFRPPPKVPDDL